MKEERKSKILKEAITEYQEILDSAKEIAKQKLAEEYKDKFNSLVNNEINNKNKAQESNDIDSTEESDNTDVNNNNNNSDMNNNVKKQETVKVNNKIGDTAPFNQKPKSINEVDEDEIPVDETVTIQDTVGDSNPFNKKGKANETVTIQKTVGDSDPFNKKGKAVDENVTVNDTVGKTDPYTVKSKTSPKIEESFDLSELNLGDDDETQMQSDDNGEFSLEDIEAELNGIDEELQGMGGLPRPGQFGTPTKQGGDPYEALVGLRKQIDEIIGGIQGNDMPEKSIDPYGFGNPGQMDEISNELVRNTSNQMKDYNQYNRAHNLRNNHVDIERLFPIGSQLAEYKVKSCRIKEDMTTAIIGLNPINRNDANYSESFSIVYNSDIDEFRLPHSIKFTREEARRLGTLAKNLNPESKYAAGTKDLPVDGYMEENNEPINDDDINQFFNQDEDPVDESLGVSHAVNKISTAHIPGADYASSPAAAERRRPGFVNENKKIAGLMEENKKLTKKINEMKKQKEETTTIVESYRTALTKYREQLKDMSLFNTNLANVNSILVNESLNLNYQDKVRIINEFKMVKTIIESQEKYDSLINEIKESKKSITESVEKIVSTSIHPSSGERLNEVVETTAFSNDPHMNRIKKVISYIEK